MAEHTLQQFQYGNSICYGFPEEFAYPSFYTQNIPLQTSQQKEFNQILMTSTNLEYQTPMCSIACLTNLSQNGIKLPVATEKANGPPSTTSYPKQRYTPYQSRFAPQSTVGYQPPTTTYAQYVPNLNTSTGSSASTASSSTVEFNRSQNNSDFSLFSSSLVRYNSVASLTSKSSTSSTVSDEGQPVVLLISNLEPTADENALKYRVYQQLKPITPVISLSGEGVNAVRVKVPSKQCAKLVVASLHRKKLGHKRMVVSYARDATQSELATIRCQVAGLLKDVPSHSLSINKFRELFQSRFKTSINIIDLFRMQDVCIITSNDDTDKVISLNPEVLSSLQSNNPLVECLQLSVPYCTIHYKQQHKGWAEQDIEPLPNVFMTLKELQNMLYTVLNVHKGDIQILSIMHCIEEEIHVKIQKNDNGVNLEHLISCVEGCQITNNQFGIKVLTWSHNDSGNSKDTYEDPLYHISHEIVELIKLSPKATLQFNKFIPAYHNHFGKQCRVADYGYTKLIDLFEALSLVVQVIGDGENRFVTLTHKTQLRRFTSELLRLLRGQVNRCVMLSQLPFLFSQFQNRYFDVTDYGVCDLTDLLDGLVHNNSIVTTVCENQDILISLPKRQQSTNELEKTTTFAEEVIELLRKAPNYSILFEKFVRSYHYNYGYQCRLSDYGCFKLTDLMETIHGIVEMETSSDEHRKIILAPKVAQRIFSEQLYELALQHNNNNNTQTKYKTKRIKIKLNDILEMHKNKYGYQIHWSNLGFAKMIDAIKALPYIELIETNYEIWLICYHEDTHFRTNCYAVCTVILQFGHDSMSFNEFCRQNSDHTSEDRIRQYIRIMNNFIKLEICPTTKQELIQLTPMMILVMKIMNIVLKKQTSICLAELKRILNLPVNGCFEFGYPNLLSLLRQFPDIFVLFKDEIAVKENYKVNLNQDCLLTLWLNSVTTQNMSAPESNQVVPCLQTQMMPHSHIDLFSTDQMLQDRGVIEKPMRKSLRDVTNVPSQENFRMSTIGNEKPSQNAINNMKSQFDSQPNMFLFDKENYHMDSLLLGSEQPQEENIMSESNMIKMFTQSTKSSELLPILPSDDLDSHSIKDPSRRAVGHEFQLLSDPLDYMKLMSTFYEVPKPDTPPLKNIPFWLDPIWSFSQPWSPKFSDVNHDIKIPDFNII